MKNIVLDIAIHAIGITVEIVRILSSVVIVMGLPANIASKIKNVTTAKICCVQNAFGMIVMSAPIVVYYTVTTAMMRTKLLAKNAIKFVVSLVECAYMKKGVLTALIASNYYQTKQSNH